MDLRERVAILENNQEELIKKLNYMSFKLEEIHTQITRYKGFLGGVMFLMSGVVIAWEMLGSWFKSHWS